MPMAMLASPRLAAATALLFTVLVSCTACAPRDRLAEVRRQQAAGNFEATIEPLRELLAEDRNDPEANYRYGLALAQTGQRGLAEWSLRQALKDPQWRRPAGRLLAYGEMISRNYETAIETLTELIEQDPDDLELLMMRANTRAHSRLHPEEALADTERILELDPENGDVMEPRILALLSLERIDEAGQAIDELGRRIEDSEVAPELVGWHCATAALFAFESGEAELAAERWKDCTARFPGHPNVVKNAIGYYDVRGELDRSLEILERAVEARPDGRDFRVLLAQRLRAQGRGDEARELLLKAARRSSPSVAASSWFDLAKHYQEVEDNEAAVEAFEQSLAFAEEFDFPLDQMKLEYADALLLAGDFRRALEVAETISVSAYREVVRARVAQERGNPQEALRHFDETFRLWPDNPWARYYAALAAEAVGDMDRAIASYRNSIRIQAGATDARSRLARLHLAQGEPQQALAILRLQADSAPLDLEAELLSLEIWSRIGATKAAKAQLELLRERSPQIHGRAVAAAARGLEERAGPAAALRLVRNASGLDLTSPGHADALRELVRLSSELTTPVAIPELQAALAAHPQAAVLHEIAGLEAELRDERAGARAAYERALAIDPQTPRARAGLCRIAPPAAPASVLTCRQALEAVPGDPEVSLATARALDSQGMPDEAVAVLETALQMSPYDATIAAALALQLSTRGEVDDARIDSLRARADRFSPPSIAAPNDAPGEDPAGNASRG